MSEEKILSTLREYLREYDTPVPDPMLRKLLRVKLVALLKDADSMPTAPLTAREQKLVEALRDLLDFQLFDMEGQWGGSFSSKELDEAKRKGRELLKEYDEPGDCDHTGQLIT